MSTREKFRVLFLDIQLKDSVRNKMEMVLFGNLSSPHRRLNSFL